MLPEKFFRRAHHHFNRRERANLVWSEPIARFEGLVDLPAGQIALSAIVAARNGEPQHPCLEVVTARPAQDDDYYFKWDNLRPDNNSTLYVPSAGFLVAHSVQIMAPQKGEMTTQVFVSLTDPNTPSTVADVPFTPTVTFPE